MARRLRRVIYVVFCEPPDLLTSSEAIKYEIPVVIFAVGTWTNEILSRPYNENQSYVHTWQGHIHLVTAIELQSPH